MKANDRRELFLRVEALANYEPVNMSDCMAFTVREIDRAVRKARREEREKHCTCQTRVKCAYCDNRKSKGSRP